MGMQFDSDAVKGLQSLVSTLEDANAEVARAMGASVELAEKIGAGHVLNDAKKIDEGREILTKMLAEVTESFDSVTRFLNAQSSALGID